MLYQEPNEWSVLQQKAQQHRNPRKLIKIIDQLNALLTAHEKRVAADDRAEQPLKSSGGNQE
jgi:hypothetical protein